MPGLFFRLNSKPSDSKPFDSKPTQTGTSEGRLGHIGSESVENSKVLFSRTFPHAQTSVVAYENYPFNVFEDGNSVIIIEGLIYNLDLPIVKSKLREISAKLRVGSADLLRTIGSFVTEADGDFLILIYDQRTHQTLVFNDRWGRLPSYYVAQPDMFICSRELRAILESLPSFTFDRISLAEVLIWQHTFGEKTLFKEVKTLRGGYALLAKFDGKVIETKILPVAPPNFKVSEVSKNRDECQRQLSERFARGIENRVKRLSSRNLQLTCDLSGGYDTRAVFAALCKTEVEFQACSDVLITGDETEIAGQLAREFGKKLTRFCARHDTCDIELFRNAVYETDCSVNGWTALCCLADDRERTQSLGGNVANFMGFGGEWLRKPYQPIKGYSTITDALMDGHYARFWPPVRSLSLFQISQQEIRSRVEEAIEQTGSDQRQTARRLYFEYFTKVVNSGENNTRKIFWTVQPFWDSEFFTFYLRSVRANWTNHKFFIQFIKQIDSRTLNIPIHGSRIKLGSPLSVNLHDSLVALKNSIRNNRALYRPASFLRSTLRSKRISESDWILNQISIALNYEAVQKLGLHNSETTALSLQGRSRLELYQLLTILIYVDEISRRFGSRLRDY